MGRSAGKVSRSGWGYAVLALLSASCVHDAALRGPLEVRNQHPAQLTVLHMPPARAVVQEAGEVSLRWDNTYSSMFLGGGNGAGNTFIMDGEILRTSLSTHLGLGHGIQLDFEVPFAHTTGGFLDGFVIDWHDTFGFPDQGRSATARNQFMVQAEQGGQQVFSMETRTLTPLDLPIGLTWNAVEPGEEGGLGVALRGAVELPTGDDDAGFGNGGIDVSLGVVGEWVGAGYGVSAFAQHTFVETPDRADAVGFEFRDVTSGGVGVEWALFEGTSALVQTEVETSTLRGLDFSRVSDAQWLLWVGLRQQVWKDLHLELALGEDISDFVSPDFSVFLGLTWIP